MPRKEHIRRVSILISKLNNSYYFRSSASNQALDKVIGWMKAELAGLDQKTRKLLTIYGSYHPKADVDKLYLRKAVGGRCLIGVEDYLRIEVNNRKIPTNIQRVNAGRSLQKCLKNVIRTVKAKKISK